MGRVRLAAALDGCSNLAWLGMALASDVDSGDLLGRRHTTGVMRLTPRSRSFCASTAMIGVPAVTVSPFLARAVKPSPLSSTVSMPM